ncbi:MAG: YdcF family protein [Xanthomonadaceae bacterium]|nr:YdcF family protein [Xanthomonadaceae bacterium]
MKSALSGSALRSIRDVMGDSALRESLAVSLVVALASGGLAVLLAWLWVLRHALVHNGCPPVDWLVICGHSLNSAQPSSEYRSRLACAEVLAVKHLQMQLFLTGGGTPSEAVVGRDWLVQRGRVESTRLALETSSRDTFENLRQVRTLLPACDSLAILSSRYHLGRLRLYASQLSLQAALVPAESAWYPTPRNLAVSLREAAFVCWFVTGRLWARLARRQRLLSMMR